MAVKVSKWSSLPNIIVIIVKHLMFSDNENINLMTQRSVVFCTVACPANCCIGNIYIYWELESANLNLFASLSLSTPLTPDVTLRNIFH